MNMIQPSRLAFWQFLLGLGSVLFFLSAFQAVRRASEMGVDFAASRSWTALVAGLILLGLLSLFLLTLTWSRYRERILSWAELPDRVPHELRWIGALLFGLALVGFTLVFMVPAIRNYLGAIGWMRFLIFLSFSVLGMWGIKMLRSQASWFIAFITIILCQSTFHLLLIYWPRVTSYPFAMGWSETSRFYYPSLFFSEKVYGSEYPWPILHPTLHLLLAPPYALDAPLWVHRLWRTFLGYFLLVAVVPAVLARLSIANRATRWLPGLWMFLYLFMGPVYFHLTIPVIVVLLGFSAENERRTWLAVLLASIWCGWSRVNWYPMPGLITAVLYLLEVPVQRKNMFVYLRKPALWFLIGTLTALIAQRVYIALSSIPDPGVFYTSFTSDLLWYRLWPNSSFSMGILPGAIWVSLPMWVTMFLILQAQKKDWHPIRLLLIFGALIAVFIGGIIVSLKIGGGANLHNMDAYFILLLIVTTYLVFARHRTEHGGSPQPHALHWLLILALMYSPVSTYLQFSVGFRSYDANATQEVQASLQEYVDAANAQGGEILFITQRHLLSMHMLNNVTLVPEYEREDLMEIAMANNEEYLARFQEDMENQRFALIVVDPLNYKILARRRGFAEENNVWVTRVMKHILCNYREEITFAVDEISLYVPQEGQRECP